MPKIMLVSNHYACVMLAEISPLNPRYRPNESPKLKTQHFNIFILLLKATKNNAVYLKCAKRVRTSIVCQQRFSLVELNNQTGGKFDIFCLHFH